MKYLAFIITTEINKTHFINIKNLINIKKKNPALMPRKKFRFSYHIRSHCFLNLILTSLIIDL